jgi:hypothetical protein
VEAGQRGDDVAVLLVEMSEGGILVEDVHPLALRENHADRAVLEHQPRLTRQENGHLLVQHQLNKVLRQPLI